MSLKGKCVAIAFVLLALPVCPAGSAEIRPLEIFSEKILIREIEHLAGEHALASAQVRKTVDRLNREMNIMSQERTRESLKLLETARGTLVVAMRTSAELSGYIATNGSQLKAAGHGRFQPLANLDKEVEKPYYQALDRFFTTAAGFVQYCNDNLEAITAGQDAATGQYDKLYAAYLKEMDAFNVRSVARSRQLGDWANEYPALWELLPR